MTALRSKWLVGSSSNNNVGSMNKALAREILILHLPEKFLVNLCCIAWSKPRPDKIWQAFASAASAFIASSCSTEFRAEASSALTSCSQKRMSIFGGMFNDRLAICLSKVDFPIPFGLSKN
ncbi:hypothetical protein BpHYR1_050374 [Brachionus plicatilis]|uniref:Uncharacterized protein n=1 Tax=Brachionus plicatilis TaxID=10195 RepID=A0A3M7SUL1_BRAPC|nr:hypothetical protein BpHYR1_050374 [Brachionus plicatilis]